MVMARSDRVGCRRKPVAVIDLGSNSVRMVVYDALARTPLPLFNEKVVCGLGSGLAATGRLNPDGVALARDAVARFVGLARAMGVAQIDVLATAAVREAEDGRAFAREIEGRHGVKVRVLSGGQEAELSALGVLCGIPDAEGIVADVGGGSCELVLVGGGRAGRHASLPLGVLRLADLSGGSQTRAERLIDEHLAPLDWTDAARGRALYAVGGAWRAVARVLIAQTTHPLRILDNFTLRRRQAETLTDLIAHQSRKSLEKIAGVSKKRIPYLPMAALLLDKILDKVRPDRLVFSVYGMREGQFYKRLSPDLRRRDPLLAACADMARAAGRFPEHADEIMDWMAPLFPGESAAHRRVRHAACLLGDAFWSEHPDYRATQAFLRVLRLPFVGLEHTDRARLALAVHARYARTDDSGETLPARAMLDAADLTRATAIGQALRLASALSGGAPGILPGCRLVPTPGALALELPDNPPVLAAAPYQRPLERLAKTLDREPAVVRAP